MSATGAAFAAGAAAALAALDVVRTLLPERGRAAAGLAALARTGTDGRDPGAVERRRMLAAGAAAAFGLTAFVFGAKAGVVAAALGPALASRLLSARRRRHRAAVERGAADMATALADALAGGHSLRGAIAQAADGVPGAAGRELRRAAGELDLGATTESVLRALARRAGPGVGAVTAACLLQRRAGGDLASLLRRSAAAFEDELRLEGEVKAATAQARFTALVVMLMPLGGALLAELARPGFAAGLLASPLTAWLAGLALAMQAGAWFAIRRLSRVAL